MLGDSSENDEWMVWLGFFLIDRLGRRPLQIGSNHACTGAFTTIGVALLANFPSTTNNTSAHWGPSSSQVPGFPASVCNGVWLSISA